MGEIEKVPYFVFEGELTRMDRTNKRLWILCICLLVALIVTNAGWIWYESQFEYYEESISQEVMQDARDGGTNRFVGGDYYGEADNQNDEND